MSIILKINLLLFTALFSIVASAGLSPLKIQRITPTGEDVPAAQQIVIEFNQPVVPLGEMQVDANNLPIHITPSVQCHWRWMDTRSLVCQLDTGDRLKPATRYKVRVSPGISAENGAEMDTDFQHYFTTERPDINSAGFQSWLTPVKPVLAVETNIPTGKASIESHLFFQANKQRFKLKAEPVPNEKKPPLEQQSNWLLTPVNDLPPDTAIELKIEPGLKSKQYPLAGVSERVISSFQTFSEFKFLGVRCYSENQQKQVFIAQSTDQPICDPQSNVYLSFNAPVPFSSIKKQLSINPSLAGGRKDYDPWAGRTFYSRLDSTHNKDQSYDIYLPEYLKAYKHYKLTSTELTDEFGRKLQTPINLAFMTEHRLANMELNSLAVLEKNVDSQMPVYVTNLNSLDINYSQMGVNSFHPHLNYKAPLPKITDIAFGLPMPIRTLLNNKPGVITGHTTMDPNPYSRKPYPLFAQVTPFQVHLKLGHFKSLIWVMDMATGLPVANAKITLYTGSMSNPAIKDNAIYITKISNEQGLAELPGLSDLDPDLYLFSKSGFDDKRFMIYVEKGQDMALLPINYNFQMWGDNSYPQTRQQYGHTNAWGTTAQGVYKPGDTIQYKLYVRDQNNETLINAPDLTWNLTIKDPTNKVVREIKSLHLNKFGAFDGELKTGKAASTGWYQFELTAKISAVKDKIIFQSQPLQVLVSDFTPAPFKLKTELNGHVFKPGDKLIVSTAARLHAGGPYTYAQTSVSVDLTADYFYSKHPIAKTFTFDTKTSNSPASSVLLQTQGKLNNKGDLETTLALKDEKIIYGTLRVESSVQDDRGKSVAKMARAKFFARDRLVGLKNTQWVYKQNKEAEVQYMVVDQKGQPIAGTPVKLKIEHQQTKASRVKSAGNAYVTQYITDWVATAKCGGISKVDPVACLFTPDKPGSYRITATIKDSKGREHTSQIHAWVVGKDQVIWQQPDNHNLSIIAENNAPKIGDTVRYLVKNPYPGSKALVTIERYGIIKSWVEDFDDSTEIIEFKVKPDYMPGFYLSVTVFSPRVAQPLGEGNVDLGKPTFSMGYTRVPVRDPYKQIDVDIKSKQESYKPGDDVELTFSAKPKNSERDEDIELAIVVLDEAVFDLILEGEDYFDPYKGFYSLDDLDVTNYSLLTRLVGRQKFETKGANTGGDGGGKSNVSFRSIEKYIGYWNPSFILKPAETKSVSFKAPDNLTGWRVFAMAVTQDDRLGLGKGKFRVNKEIELRPVMPNQVMQGDQFQAGFSIMNRTEKAREISINIKASGNIGDNALIDKTVTVEPYKRKAIWLPIHSTQAGKILVTATAKSGNITDALVHTIPVLKRRVMDTAAVYGTFTKPQVTSSILFPNKIHNDVGELNITISPSVIGNIDGAFKYIRDYPYWCWEQRLTKGVMADQFQNLHAYLPDDLKWDNSEALANKMINDAADFQAANGGMAFWIPKDEYVSPYLTAYTALAFGWLQDTGHKIPEQIEAKLNSYLYDMLKRDVMPSFYDKGMASTVRAVALAALAKQDKLTLTDLQRFRKHVPQMSLFGKAHYLLAANKIKGAEAIVSELTNEILSHSVQSAGKFQFNEKLTADYQRILASPMRTQCAILSALTETAKTPQGKKLVADAPFKIVRAITQGRGSKTYWQNTQENMFCINALNAYSRVYEAKLPSMLVKAKLDDTLLGTSTFNDKRDPELLFTHAINKQDPGRKATVTIEKEGNGRLYYTTRLKYAKLDSEAKRINSGIEIRREYSIKRNNKWQLLITPMQIKRGELVRVDLFVSLPAVRNYVVIDDPVPGGLEPVNRDLATASIMDAEAGSYQASGNSFWFEHDDWEDYNHSRWSFYHQELRHDSVRFYSDYLSPGHYHLSYTAQAIATGTFAVLPATGEEMYDSDIYGHTLPAILKVSD